MSDFIFERLITFGSKLARAYSSGGPAGVCSFCSSDIVNCKLIDGKANACLVLLINDSQVSTATEDARQKKWMPK